MRLSVGGTMQSGQASTRRRRFWADDLLRQRRGRFRYLHRELCDGAFDPQVGDLPEVGVVDADGAECLVVLEANDLVRLIPQLGKSACRGDRRPLRCER